MSNVFVALGAALWMLALSVHADSRGLAFSHHDWELVCDNTRTCRAAGYQSDQDELPVSVLLTRKAGPNEPVTGELMIGNYDNEALIESLPSVLKLSMRINERRLGQVLVRIESLVAKLSPDQVTALTTALARDSNVEWVAGDHVWHLSDKGAAAVLLKMDEFQGRLGTKGALIKKGARGEDAVLRPLPLPVVVRAPFAKPVAGDSQLAANVALRKSLEAKLKVDDYCPDLTEQDSGRPEIEIARLNDSKLLVSAQCWSGAYNVGYGYWMVDAKPPFDAVLVTTSASEYSEGIISASHKGRGLGDCWSSDAWTWDGTHFVHTDSSSTGMCKLIAPGGAWSLPRIITDVRNPQ